MSAKSSLLLEAQARAASVKAAKIDAQQASSPISPNTQQQQQQQQLQQQQEQRYTAQSPTFASIPPLPPSPQPQLTAKDAAELARENWRHNESKMNVKATSEKLASGGTVAPRWVPNREKANCTQCHIVFDWAKRRHHCRRCGDVRLTVQRERAG